MELGLCIIILLATFYFYFGLPKSLELAKKAKIKLLGIEAQATILFIEEGDDATSQPFKIQIQVEPVMGRNFVTVLTDVPRAYVSFVKVGAKVRIKYLVKNQKEVVFVNFIGQF
ncbi:hypothetical protein LXM25_13405 [Dyadobacter sp. LJ53]|uniref:hypothetical protein n=1 Tax=Dyadobacter chenwenxiniae TaxID=2906456 RepID=UPI001F458916|nr:hypothetical protein [Dyadobacter chenwenxiniae]MCF0051064.1 hypothetical protein [Dyadobacter chenwenxiniae]